MTEAAIAMLAFIVGALAMLLFKRKPKPVEPKKLPLPKPPTPDIDYAQSLDEITNPETPPPLDTDHLSDADWWEGFRTGQDGNDS